MAILGMQEPQYASPGVRELLTAVGKAGLPTLSIMNMPPLPYLARLPGLDVTLARAAYGDPEVWDAVAPETITLCSPDPQAVRPQGEPANTLVVRLPTNFKAATFARAADAAKLTQLGADVDAVQADGVDLPVKLKVHDSVFVPLAKWAMLLAGNYRCVGADGMRPIREAVHADLAASKRVYEYVVALCVRLGADAADMVPFEKYAAAATSLANPSSAARSLAGGATAIERVDKLVQSVGRAVGQTSADVDATVALVDGWLKKNRVGSQSQ
jgi:hypothetical protein